MLTPENLKENQRTAIDHQRNLDHSMLWMGCGTGKTVVTLTMINDRMKSGEIKKAIVFGPVRVIHSVWERESKKWSHLQHLRFSIVGFPNEKKRIAALEKDADVYLCNYENMNWLAAYIADNYIRKRKLVPFQCVVYDEVTRMKNIRSKRITGGKRLIKPMFVRRPDQPSESELKSAGVKGKQLTERMSEITQSNALALEIELSKLYRQRDKFEKINAAGKLIIVPEETKTLIGWRQIIPHIRFRTGLTGTPAPNGYEDLLGQYFSIDGGQRLGSSITHYRDNYFRQGYDGWSYEITSIGEQLIQNKIHDITIEIPPENTKEPFFNTVAVDLPETAMIAYREIENEMFTRLDDGTEIELFNRASVSNKCLQFANGSPYKEANSLEWSDLHDAKLQALDSIVEEAAGNTILLGYNFRSDAERIMKRYKKLKPINITDSKPSDMMKILEMGNAGKIKLMIGHPASLGHGVDGLNDFCQILVWFGLPWSLELYVQMIGRLASGERFKKPVTIHQILANNTLDFAVVDTLTRKESGERALKDAITRYRNRRISFL